MEPLWYVSRGKNREADTGKRDYRHRVRIGCVEKRQVAHQYFCDPHMQETYTDPHFWLDFIAKPV
jgi:hypothetical protein